MIHLEDCDCADCHEGNPALGMVVGVVFTIGFGFLVAWIGICLFAEQPARNPVELRR